MSREKFVDAFYSALQNYNASQYSDAHLDMGYAYDALTERSEKRYVDADELLKWLEGYETHLLGLATAGHITDKGSGRLDAFKQTSDHILSMLEEKEGRG